MLKSVKTGSVRVNSLQNVNTEKFPISQPLGVPQELVAYRLLKLADPISRELPSGAPIGRGMSCALKQPLIVIVELHREIKRQKNDC